MITIKHTQKWNAYFLENYVTHFFRPGTVIIMNNGGCLTWHFYCFDYSNKSFILFFFFLIILSNKYGLIFRNLLVYEFDLWLSKMNIRNEIWFLQNVLWMYNFSQCLLHLVNMNINVFSQEQYVILWMRAKIVDVKISNGFHHPIHSKLSLLSLLYIWHLVT